MTSSPAKTIALLPENESLQQQTRNTKEDDDKALLSKCEVDPVKAQDDAMISIALKLQKNQMSVNEFSVDEARTTMVRSNYAPDWTRANWSHPLLANLKNLSCLSSFDLPSHTKRGLVDERKAIAYGQQEAGSSRALSLENNDSKILEYFEIIEGINISRDQKDLIKFKKALFFLKNSKKSQGEKILNDLILSNSKLKKLASEVLAE